MPVLYVVGACSAGTILASADSAGIYSAASVGRSDGACDCAADGSASSSLLPWYTLSVVS